MDSGPVARRLRVAIELYEVGEQLQRSRLRRLNPGATDAEVEAEVRAWLRRRPGAEHGDFPGPASTRFA